MQTSIKKAFTAAVVASTIAWSVGLSAIPFAAKAAASGSLVKASLPAVYYVGADGKRYVFPNEKTYKTWFADFGSVQTITDAELAAMGIGGNVTYKPGVRMVKITTDPKVYAVDAGGALRWVSTEAAAVALYGASWNQMIDDVPDAFFTNYTIGADIASASDFDSAAVAAAALSINVDKGLSSTADGDLSVTLGSSQTMGGTLPLGAMGVNVLRFDVRNNGGNDLIVDSLTLRRSGPGESADWANVYVYRDNDRLTTGRTINSTTHEVTVGGLNTTLAAGAMRSFSIIGDVATGGLAGDVHMFELSALTSGAVAATGLPLMGPSFTLSGATAGSIAIASTSTLSNIRAGALGAKMGQFTLTTATENQNVSKIVLAYNGTVTRDNVSNLVLKQAGNTLATVANISGSDQVVFVLATPFEMERGNVRTFEVFGDLNGSARAAQTINFFLDQNADLLSIGQTYGYGVSISANTLTSGLAAATATVEAGRLTIAYNGPAAANIAPRAQDVELFNFTMSAASNLEVRTTTFSFAFVGAALADFSDIKLVDTATGQVVAGPYTAATPLAMSEVINLTAGQARTFKLTADVENTPIADETITATLDAFGATAIRNLDNSTYLAAATDIVPPGAIGGNAFTVKVASLTSSAASMPVAQTYIVGSTGAELGGLILKAGDATDMKVSSITLDGGTSGIGGAALVSTVSAAGLWNGSTQVGDLESPAATTGDIIFDNLNLTIPAGQSVSLTMKGDFHTTATTGTVIYRVALAADVSTTDGDGNSVTAIGTYPVVFNTMTVASAGTLTVALAPTDTETEAGLVVGSGSNVVLGKYKFTAVNEELKLIKSRFSVGTAAGVVSLSLYDGATLVGGPEAVDGSSMAYFSGMNFVIPKDGSKTLTVKANLSAVGALGVAAGSAVTVTLQDGYQGAALDGFFEVRGTSAGSSTLIQEFLAATTDNDITAAIKLVHKSKPTISLVTLPTSVIGTGGIVAMRFTIAADAAGDIALKSITGTLTSASTSAYTITAPALRKVGDGSDLAGTGGVTGTCTATANTCVLHVMLTSEEVIPAGTARTYDLRVNRAGTLTTGDSMSTSLTGDVAAATGDITAVALGVSSVATVARNFVWSDISLVTHDDDHTALPTSADWTSGFYIKVLPTDGQTMTK